MSRYSRKTSLRLSGLSEIAKPIEKLNMVTELFSNMLVCLPFFTWTSMVATAKIDALMSCSILDYAFETETRIILSYPQVIRYP